MNAAQLAEQEMARVNFNQSPAGQMLKRAQEFMSGRNAVDLAPLCTLAAQMQKEGPYVSSQRQLEYMVAAFLVERDKVR